MRPFPYIEILKKAYELTRKHLWLWAFGLFIGGSTGINFGSFNFVLSPRRAKFFKDLPAAWAGLQTWLAIHSRSLPWLIALFFLVVLVLVIFSGLSRGGVVWATAELQKDPQKPATPPGFVRALRAAQKYLWRIIGLQVLISFGLIVLSVLFLAPIGYLFSVGAIGRAVVLSLLGLVILLPAVVVFRFLHLYGPIFLVVYGLSIRAALQYSFNLLMQKIWEGLVLIAFLLGLSIAFLLLLVFSIILLSLPVSILALVSLNLGFPAAFYTLVILTAAVSIVYTIFLSAGFAVFQNVVWVLAVAEMVRTRKLPEKARILATEPA